MELDKITRVCLHPIQVDNEIRLRDFEVATIQKCIDRRHLFYRDGHSLKLWHPNGFQDAIGSGKRCGYTFYELDTLTEIERHHLNHLDVLFVPTEWAKQVALDNCVVVPEIIVAPLGVDRTIFHEGVVPYIKNTKHETVFLHVGKAEWKRKGLDVLCEAFHNAFQRNDNVKLLLSIENPFIEKVEYDRIVNEFRGGKMGGKVQFLPRFTTQSELASIMASADCGVFPSRAEGWSCPNQEMMSIGKQVICTNYSGFTGYINDKNSMLINISGLEPAIEKPFFYGQGNWASFNEETVDSLIFHMRYIHNSKQNGVDLKNSVGVNQMKAFTWEKTATIINRNING